MNFKEHFFMVLKRRAYAELTLEILREMDFSGEEDTIKFVSNKLDLFVSLKNKTLTVDKIKCEDEKILNCLFDDILSYCFSNVLTFEKKYDAEASAKVMCNDLMEVN